MGGGWFSVGKRPASERSGSGKGLSTDLRWVCSLGNMKSTSNSECLVFNPFDPFGLRAYRDRLRALNDSRRRANELDRSARALRLDARTLGDWTERVKAAAKIVSAGKSPCDYGPWEKALRELARAPPYVGPVPEGSNWLSSDLMQFAADVAQPRWPEPTPELIEFALAFLEADVMLFRSGYVKRHLLKRLQQSELIPDSASRVILLLRRAIYTGVSVEEFRAYCKLAAHLCKEDDAGGLVDWLGSEAHGAFITLDRADGALYARMIGNPELSDTDRSRLQSHSLFGRSKWGILYPEFAEVVSAEGRYKDPQERAKSSAFRMLEAVLRRRAEGMSR